MPTNWYLKTWFIALLFAASTFTLGISFVIGIILVIAQYKHLADMANKYGSVDEINKFVTDKRREAEGIISQAQSNAEEILNKNSNEVSSIKNAITSLEKQKVQIQKELESLNIELVVESINLSEYENITSEECKNTLEVLRIKQQDFVRQNKALIISSSDSKKTLDNNIKQILRCFNAECERIILNANTKNIDTARSKISKSYDTLNKIFSTDGVSINTAFLEMKLDELNIVYAYYLKKEQEREQQKAIKEQMIEEEKVRREIEREKQKIEKEESQFKNEISKLMGYMQKSTDDIQTQLYVDKIRELEKKLELLEKDKENVLLREQNTRAGFVYVISNIGSFGDDVYKIGMTRRLEPMDRIKELSDASVPFEFDVHAMIFSEDAPALENILHRTFRKKEINKVNSRKEFFRASLLDIKKTVKDNFNATVEFTEFAEAREYRESLRLVSNGSMPEIAI